jgi:hypothetical protein
MTEKDGTDLFFRSIWVILFTLSALAIYEWFM